MILLSCNPIILIGQDLAYSDGRCYSKDSPYYNLKCKINEKTGRFEVKADDLDSFIQTMNVEKEQAKEIAINRFEELTKNLYFVKGHNNEMLPTDPGYATFIRYFENTAKEFGHEIKFINSTEGGAYLEGYEHIPLKEALEKYSKESFDVEEIVAPLAIIVPDIKVNGDLRRERFMVRRNIILPQVEEMIELIESNFIYFEQGRSSAGKLARLLNMNRIYDKNFKKYCEEALNNFIALEKKVISQNIIILGAILPEYTKLTSHLVNSPDAIDMESIKKFVYLVNDFFVNTGYYRIKDLLKVLNYEKRRLSNAGSNSESKESVCAN